MMRRLFSSASSKHIGQPAHATHPELIGSGELFRGISRNEFASRRAALCSTILTTSINTPAPSALIFVSNEEKYLSHDANHRFHQNTTFSYLFGFHEPQSVAVLVPRTGEWFLFSREHDPVKEMWDGPICGPARALDAFQCANTFGIKVLDKVLPKLVKGSDGEEAPIVVSGDAHFAKQVDNALLQRVLHCLGTATKIAPMEDANEVLQLVDKQRLVKSAAELDCIRKACEITGAGHLRAMQRRMHCKTERALQAEVEYGFNSHALGGDGVFYQSIVAGGNRACTLHYSANDMRFSATGELCLIDAGARLLASNGYGGDVTRTFPVLQERFTPAQRDVYFAVLDVLDHVLQNITSGLTMQQLHAIAMERMRGNLRSLLLPRSDAVSMEETRRYFPHGIGHFMGLDVHDTPTIARTQVLPGNAVITVEPGLYFDERDETVPRELRGIGIRLEDNVVVLPNGCENLTRRFAPVRLEEVERIL